MRFPDPAADANDGVRLYECPECGGRTEARGSCCCPACGVEMLNLTKPRDC
jgi:ABC-type ATPase with predicted acetyltransferase domain